MSKYKVTHTFALTNKRLMRKLERYSAKGWHFKKFLGFFILLEKGEKINYKYELVYDKKFDSEREDFYKFNGWRVVRNSFFWQILRGEPTAITLYTDNLSEEYMWLYRIRFNAKIMLGCFLIALVTHIINKFLMPFVVIDFISGMSFGFALGLGGVNIAFFIKYLFLKRRKD
ncbi:DUF2812 domain-containing protein [Gemella haemolysans]|uniref:DUF2812 domain-containing protein n=1 Tax=Gemella haemolysans TaxID=1379 RepID=UPI00195DF2EC|nr:DUF2812 domain-containing protein [Gemella haemolysans]VTX73685.1 Uncharacterised protein [Gemella haemolysans]